MCRILVGAGAVVTGFSLEPATDPNLFGMAGIQDKITSVIGDIRDMAWLKATFDRVKPEIVIHMAAQALVREGYEEPRYTYETNVMGTVNILECVRLSRQVRSFLNVTTDKVYRNNEWEWGYRENEALDGYDPYSSSKSCSELVTGSYRRSFFADSNTAISTARSGNVIGGGDFASDRLIPDCVRGVQCGEKIAVRNPSSIRPYQHVLEPLFAYLTVAQEQHRNPKVAGSYNVGPEEKDCITSGSLVELFCSTWGNGAEWETAPTQHAPHEANSLRLDCSRIKLAFGWQPRWHIRDAVAKTCEWTRAWLSNEDIPAIMDRQIAEYLAA